MDQKAKSANGQNFSEHSEQSVGSTFSLQGHDVPKMQEFERQQHEQFQRDMEDQRNILEIKQREYKVKMRLWCITFNENITSLDLKNDFIVNFYLI